MIIQRSSTCKRIIRATHFLDRLRPEAGNAVEHQMEHLVGLEGWYSTFTLSQRCVTFPLVSPSQLSPYQLDPRSLARHGASGSPYESVCPHCGSVHSWTTPPCMPLSQKHPTFPRSAAPPAWPFPAPQPTNKEQRKFGGSLLAWDPAMRQVRDNQSSLLRRPCSSLDKEAHTMVVQRIIETKNLLYSPLSIMAVRESSCAAIGHRELSLSTSMPVEQEAYTLPPPSPDVRQHSAAVATVAASNVGAPNRTNTATG